MLCNTRALSVSSHGSICLGSHPHQEGLRAKGCQGHVANNQRCAGLLFPQMPSLPSSMVTRRSRPSGQKGSAGSTVPWGWAHTLSPTSRRSSTYRVRKERWGSWDRMGGHQPPSPFPLELPPLPLAESGTLTWEPHGTAPFTISLEAVGSNNLSTLLQLRFTLCSCSRSQECDYSDTVTLGGSSLQVVCWKAPSVPHHACVPMPVMPAVFPVHPSSSCPLSQCHCPFPSWQPAGVRVATRVPSARTLRTPAPRDASPAWAATRTPAAAPARPA